MESQQRTKYEGLISTRKLVFFSFNGIISGLLFAYWGQIQYFAASVLLIPQATITIIYLIYSIIDGINDPVIGYLCDKSSFFTAKFGKRFPWIMIGVLASPILLFLAFIPISNVLLIQVIWLIVIMTIFESFMTLYEVNHSALFPDMFREFSQRRKVVWIASVISGIISIFTSIMIPRLLGALGGVKLEAYIGTGLVVIIIVYLLIIPFSFGVKEPNEMKVFRSALDSEKKSFSKVKEILPRIFKDKNWMAIVLANFLWAVAGACSIYGLNFYITHALGLPIETTALPSFSVAVVALIFAPIWTFIAKKIGNRKAYILGLSIVSLFYLIFFLFGNSLISLTLIYLFGGVGFSATYGVIARLLRAEGIDNAAVITGKREEGSYNGILRVFSAFSYFFQTLIFAIVAILTGYDPALGTANTEIAKLGLKVQMSLIPLIINTIGLIIFILMYKITKEQAEHNKLELIKLNL
ncbi:MAG: MFS transporter [Promethearchaeota archaeon]